MKFLHAIFAGSLVSFASTKNGHVQELLHESRSGQYMQPGYRVVREYQCTSSSIVLQQFSLDKWRHKHDIELLEPLKVKITDTMTWSSTIGRRAYVIQPCSKQCSLKRHSEPWVFDRVKSRYHSTLNAAIRKNMDRLDTVIFDDFVKNL